MSKNEIIAKICNGPAGFGSKKSTLEDARVKDKTITLDDVTKWYSKNVQQKTTASGENSYVAKKPYEEFQIDIFYINDLIKQKTTNGLLIIDIFTKLLTVVPLVARKVPDITASLTRGLREMGGDPEMIYSDNETSMGYMFFF